MDHAGVAVDHLGLAELQDGLDEIRRSPADRGPVELIVRRPAIEEREVLTQATLDETLGLVGDDWVWKPTGPKRDGAPDPGAQLTLMNVRVASLVARDPERRVLAGDQLYVDLDLSLGNLPPGTRLRVGSALIEVTAVPHRGCGKFTARFGVDAMKFVNSKVGRELNLRGINARVVQGGTVHVGDLAEKLL